MAVYTEVGRADLAAFLAGFEVGDVRSFTAIADGTENTNYRLATTQGKFVLTLFESRTPSRDLPFVVALMDHLSRRNVVCPVPVPDRGGRRLHELCGRPAVLVTFLEGRMPRRITPAHCGAVGAALAGLHLASRDFTENRTNRLSVGAWRRMFEPLADRSESLRPGLSGLIGDEIDALERDWPGDLPSGVIHGDLFPDNVFFAGNRLSGLIDFYFACRDLLAYDLAVTLISWCFDARQRFDSARADALVAGYRSARGLEPEELRSLPLLARGAAMRFFLTRLEDWFDRPEGVLSRRKDPLEMAAIIEFHRGPAGRGAYGVAT